NGRSSYEPPVGAVAMPELADLSHAIAGLRRLERDRASGTIELVPGRPEIVSELGGSFDNPTDVPTAGQAYAPRWNDSLRGVVLRAYYEEFLAEGLSPREAQRRAEEFMLVVAMVN